MRLTTYFFKICNRDDSTEARVRQSLANDAVDNKFGFERITGNVDRVGWLLNMHSVGQHTCYAGVGSVYLDLV